MNLLDKEFCVGRLNSSLASLHHDGMKALGTGSRGFPSGWGLHQKLMQDQAPLPASLDAQQVEYLRPA